MKRIDQLDCEILNATADEWENLEQIFLSVCFEYSQPAGGTTPGEGSYRRVRETVLLEEIADRIQSLVSRQLLQVGGEHSSQGGDDLGYVWRGWFSMTPEGRQAWTDHETTNLAGTK